MARKKKVTVDLRLKVELEIEGDLQLDEIIAELDCNFNCPDGVTARVLDVEQIG